MALPTGHRTRRSGRGPRARAPSACRRSWKPRSSPADRRWRGRRAGQRRQDPRLAAAARAGIGLRLTMLGAAVVVGLGAAVALPTRDGLGKQLSTKREPGRAMAIGEEAEVADAMEAGGQHMQEEA